MTILPQLEHTPFRLSGVRIGMFDEDSALEGSWRNHESADGLNVSGKTTRIIPFGCEYEVTRTWDAACGMIRFAVDVRALNNGTIRECMLDGLQIASGVVRAGVLEDDGTCRWAGSADGALMPRAVEILLADGTAAELAAGDDLWRHRPAPESGNNAFWKLDLAEGKLDFSRRMLQFESDADISNRPWRWEYFLVWGKPGAVLPDPAAELVDCSGICFAAPAIRRSFRDMIRRAKRPLRLVNIDPMLCREAAHTGRGRELLHQDAGELLSFYLWANRTLRSRDLALTAELTQKAAESRPALQAVLSTPLRGLD